MEKITLQVTEELKQQQKQQRQKQQQQQYKNLLLYLSALLLGASLALSFAPFNLWYLSFFSIAGLHYLLEQHKTFKFSLGFCYGLGVFGSGVSWVFVSIHSFGELHYLLASFFTLWFIASFASLTGIALLLYQNINSNNKALKIISFATFLITTEWVRSNLLTGFPWLLIGYGQIDGWLAAYIPIVGVYGVSFLTCIIASCLMFYLTSSFRNVTHKLTHNLILLIIPVSIFGAASILQHIDWVEEVATTHTAALCQSNLTPVEKVTTYGNIQKTWDLYQPLTVANLDKTLIVWPEHSLPVPYPASKLFSEELQKLMQNYHSGLIIGALSAQDAIHTNNNSNDNDNYNDYDFNDNELLYYNSLIGIDKHGLHFYHKKNLVPFGEYIPFNDFLGPILEYMQIPVFNLARDYSSGTIKVNDIKILPAICYEITFAKHIRNLYHQIPFDVIVNISEDGWFGKSLGPSQHLQISRVRALESGKYVLRSATSGYSAIINHKGKITNTIEQFTYGCATGSFHFTTGQTPWLKYGDKLLWFILFSNYIYLISAYVRSKLNTKVN